jgi:2-amino-4-hydroxy-6-hydroxymethyldihydropteridine diphosphokinase
MPVTREMPVTLAYVAFGSNLGDREQGILSAADALGVRRLSALRETEPWGVTDQPPFLNAVGELETGEPPRALLERLLGVERAHGRIRLERWGPRTLDLDLLLYGGAEIDEPGLTVPHPRLHERAFVLEPLAELAPDLNVPGKGRVRDLLARLQSA